MNETLDVQMFDYRRWILHRVKFSILLGLQIPAVVLSLLIFYFFLTNHTSLKIPQNRSLLILLIVNFFQITVLVSLSIHLYAVGSVKPATPIYCTLWTFITFVLNGMSEYLMATIAIQQHMLIFHSHVLRIRWKRFTFHYFPLIFFLIYPTVFYTFLFILYPCDGTQWDYTSTTCGIAHCYLVYDKVLGTFDWLFNVGAPAVVIALANASLILRVIQKKRQHHRQVRWREQRRMTIQLICLSGIYLICWTPSLLVGIVQLLVRPTFLADLQTHYFIELSNIICLLLPWVCLGFLPQVLNQIKAKFHVRPARNAVGTIGHPT